MTFSALVPPAVPHAMQALFYARQRDGLTSDFIGGLIHLLTPGESTIGGDLSWDGSSLGWRGEFLFVSEGTPLIGAARAIRDFVEEHRVESDRFLAVPLGSPYDMLKPTRRAGGVELVGAPLMLGLPAITVAEGVLPSVGFEAVQSRFGPNPVGDRLEGIRIVGEPDHLVVMGAGGPVGVREQAAAQWVVDELGAVSWEIPVMCNDADATELEVWCELADGTVLSVQLGLVGNSWTTLPPRPSKSPSKEPMVIPLGWRHLGGGVITLGDSDVMAVVLTS